MIDGERAREKLDRIIETTFIKIITVFPLLSHADAYFDSESFTSRTYQQVDLLILFCKKKCETQILTFNEPKITLTNALYCIIRISSIILLFVYLFRITFSIFVSYHLLGEYGIISNKHRI